MKIYLNIVYKCKDYQNKIFFYTSTVFIEGKTSNEIDEIISNDLSSLKNQKNIKEAEIEKSYFGK